ncbi:hypothetical protein MTO96_010222 [Rhipicephalus appendiculatus]
MAAGPAGGPGGAAAAPGALQTATRAEFAVLVKGSEETAHWLADLLRAELLLVEVVPVSRNTRWLLLVRLKPEDAPAMAEKVGVFKLHRSGCERPFVLDHWRDFGRGGETSPEELFSLTERQEIVQNVIDGIRAEQLTEVVGLGHRCVLIHPGQSVFAVCFRAEIVVALFAPHDYELLSAIRRQWLSNLTIPVHMIKVYFGIRIAFYYAFLSFYTWSLMVPMTVGVLVFKHRDSLQWRIAGVLFNLLWNTVILERAFRIIISQVVVLFCVAMCVLQQYQYLTLEAYVSGTFPTSALGDAAARVVPGVVNTLVGMAFSDVYRALSQRMTEWENHQTQAEYLQHLTYKLIVFDFFGRFGSLFYTAFYLQDIQLLRKQVYIQLLMSFTKDNLVEIVMPRALRRLTSLARHMIRRESIYLPGVHSILERGGHGPSRSATKGIGIWEPAFRAIGFLAVPTNIALICVENPDSLSALSRLFTDTEFVLFLVGIEHALLLLKLTLQYALRSEVHCPHYSPAVTT